MRSLRLRHAAWLAASIASTCLASFAGCATADTAGETAAGGSPTTSTGTGGDGGAAGAGGSGGAPQPCDETLTPAEDACVLTDDLGVFVRTEGNDGHTGTQDEPVATLSHAVELAAVRSPGKRRVYACAQDFDEALVVPAGVEIYGGLDCKNDWTLQSAKRTRVHGPADGVAVRVSAGEATTRLEDLEVVAADATLPGGSSIAVLVDGATVELLRCKLQAGKGAAGIEGVDGPVTPPTPAPTGAGGIDACVVSTTAPGAPAMDNPLCGASIGGKGGDGGLTTGGDAEEGSPAPGDGLGGWGEISAGPWSCPGGFLTIRGNGYDGTNGADGVAGMPGTGLGTLSVEGYSGPGGSDGAPGLPAQGGGGGGGAKSDGGSCAGKAGASGGSGGAGGCGGLGGGGGSAGGASIALVSIDGSVTLTSTTLVAGDGGNGGSGGEPQAGGAGGSGGPGGSAPAGLNAGCKGGTGGTGGKGGPGGGGAGGHSLGIAYVGTAPNLLEGTQVQIGAPGAGGVEGSAGTTTGDAGQAAETLAF